MATDHAAVAQAALHNYFGGDAERLEKCLTLAQYSVWTTNYRMPPPATSLALAREVFPSLSDHVELKHGLTQDGVPASKIPVTLLEKGDVQGALVYLAAAVASKGNYALSQESIEGVEEMFLHVSTHFLQVLTFTAPDAWMASTDRMAFIDLIKAMDPLFDITQEWAAPALLTAPVASKIYSHGDIALFDSILNNPHFNIPNCGSFVLDLGDLWKPAQAGNIPLQKQLLALVDADRSKFAGPIKAKATLSFWNGVHSYFDALDQSGILDDWRELFTLATDAFNYDSLPNGKAALTSQKLFQMLLNMPRLAQRAKAAGLELTIKQYRAALMPLEESAKAVGRAFVPYMGNADYEDMKDALGLLFKDIAPSDLSNRPLPKHLASIMSDVMDDTRWIGKASLRDRGRILSDDLGL